MPISHAVIYHGPTNLPQTHLLRAQLAFLNQPAQVAPHLPCTGLLIVLNSWGGNTYEARSLYGLLRAVPYPVAIHVSGIAQSAAIPLMLAADRRTAAPNATFLFHQWVWGTEAHPGLVAETLKETAMRLEDEVRWAKSTFEARTALKNKEIDALELFQKTRIEDAAFALKHQFIHEIVELKIPPSIMTWNIA